MSRPSLRIVPPPPPRAPEDDWRDRLITKMVGPKGDKYEVVVPIHANVTTFLLYHPAWENVLAYDELRERVVKLKEPPWHGDDAGLSPATGDWTDLDTTRLMSWLARVESLQISVDVAERGLETAADAKHSHPIRDYFAVLKWDEIPRIDRLFVDYFGTEETPYALEVATRFMIQAVARAKRPGCQADMTVVLEGAQGIKKTSAMRTLCVDPGWYTENAEVDGKTGMESIQGTWFCVLDELSALKGRDAEKWKTFLTRVKDRFRPAYGRRLREFFRQNIFVGTTNDDQYLVDRTGNRRFHPIKCGVTGAIDVKGLEEIRDQLWAEAYHRFLSGEAWYITDPSLRAHAANEQAERVKEDSWGEMIAEWLECPREWLEEERKYGAVMPFPDGGVTVRQVLTHALKIKPEGMGPMRGAEMRAAAVLSHLGYTKRRVQICGIQATRWYKV